VGAVGVEITEENKNILEYITIIIQYLKFEKENYPY
jgi:hypothetical protein